MKLATLTVAQGAAVGHFYGMRKRLVLIVAIFVMDRLKIGNSFGKVCDFVLPSEMVGYFQW